MLRGKLAALTMVAVLATFGSSKAAVIDRSFSTTATFDEGPYSIVTFKYDLQFDPTNASAPTISNYSSSVKADTFNGNIFANRQFESGIENSISIGNALYGFMPGDNNFLLTLGFDQQGNVDLASENYTLYSVPGASMTYGSIAQVTLETPLPIAGGVPEPSTWILSLLGFGGLGLLAYRKRKSDGATALMPA